MHREWTIAVVALLLCAPFGAAQEAVSPDDATRTANRAISELRSPYCPGLMLEVCPSEPAEMLRDSIHDQARTGLDADELVEWVLARHGEEWRAVPKRQGFGLWAWILPPLALVLGGLVVVTRLRSSVGEPAVAHEASRSLTPGEEEVLRRAMLEMEREEDR